MSYDCCEIIFLGYVRNMLEIFEVKLLRPLNFGHKIITNETWRIQVGSSLIVDWMLQDHLSRDNKALFAMKQINEMTSIP